MFNLSALTYMSYLGISVAVTVRVGNLLGAGHADVNLFLFSMGFLCVFVCVFCSGLHCLQ